MFSYIYGAQFLVFRVSRDAWRDAETRDQGRSVRFWKCTHTQTRGIWGNFLATFSKGHFNKWKNPKYKVKLRHYKYLLPIINRKSTYFSSTHVRICVKAATPLGIAIMITLLDEILGSLHSKMLLNGFSCRTQGFIIFKLFLNFAV